MKCTRRHLCLLMALLLCVGMLAGCGKEPAADSSSDVSEPDSVATTTSTTAGGIGETGEAGETTTTGTGSAATTTATKAPVTTKAPTTKAPTTQGSTDTGSSNGSIRIGGFCGVDPNFADKQHIKEIAEAGIDYIYIESGFHPMVLKKIGEWCDQYGVEWMLTDDKLYGFSSDFTKAAELTADYRKYDSFIGNFIRDEPGASQFDGLAKAVKDYKSKLPKYQAVINLLPAYATKAQIEADSYQSYVDQYVAKIPTDFVAVDIYPCTQMSDGTKTTWEGYAENLDIVATAARKSGREFWGFLQTTTWSNGHRLPDETDLRWQAYAHLAFGAVNLIHFTYRTPGDKGGEVFRPAMIDRNGNKTDTWYAAQKVNNEIHALSDVFMQYKNVGAFHHGYNSSVPYLQFANQYKGSAAIQSIDCAEPLLVGCFEKKAGKGGAAMLVNMSNLQDKESATVRFKTRDSGKVTVHMNGKSTVLTANGGVYQVTLPCGAGAFITVT